MIELSFSVSHDIRGRMGLNAWLRDGESVVWQTAGSSSRLSAAGGVMTFVAEDRHGGEIVKGMFRVESSGSIAIDDEGSLDMFIETLHGAKPEYFR
jgi:hypothetical protein